MKSAVNSKEKLHDDHNDELKTNDLKWNKYDKYGIDDIRNWLIQNDFIGMKDHCDTLFYDIHTLELMQN